MPAASWPQTSFLGGTWSKTAQGRFDDPGYRIALSVCLNGLPIEAGAWTRRPGTMFAGSTRGGAPGRVIAFPFKAAQPYTIEFTDGFIRLRTGATFVSTNDDATIVAISTANPAVVQISAAATWLTGNSAVFKGLGKNDPLLQNRVVTLTKIDTTHFSIADAITGATIDGSTLGAFVSGTISRILEIASPYVAGAWSSATLRAVTCDIPLVNGETNGAVLFSNAVAPQVLQVASQPTLSTYATFTFGPADLQDGPYFDPVPGGTLAVPSAQIGVITLTLSFNAYNAAVAYSIGDYVTSSSVNYKSLVNANVGNTPASSPSDWVTVAATDPIGGTGFTNADIGRHVRLFSEPPLWAVGTTYAANAVVAYGGTGQAGFGAGYWSSVAGSNTGNIPGTDLTHWDIATNAATWTWGKITGLSNIISGSTGVGHIGDLTQSGGLSAGFDGVLFKSSALSPELNFAPGGLFAPGQTIVIDTYIGQNYTGTAQEIEQVTVYPTSDVGLVEATWNDLNGFFFVNPEGISRTVTVNLWASATAPSGPQNGTLLGTSGQIANTLLPVTVVSTNQTTSWNYVWVEIIGTGTSITDHNYEDPTLLVSVAQVVFIAPFGTGTSQGINVQIIGGALQYPGAVRTWRLGLLGGSNGFPTCGVFHEGRLGLFGVVGNRIDLGRANDTFNMAPTDPDGSVPDNAAISYPLLADDTNPVFSATSDDRGIILRTQAGEWLVSATTQNLPLSPTNIQAHRVTHYGGANIEPVRANQAIVMVQRFARKLLEYFADVFSGRLTAPHLSENSQHLTQTFLQEIAYQNELSPNVWARRGDGGLVGWAYKRDNMFSSQGPKFIGGHRHVLGSGRTVESICVGPSVDGTVDALTMVTNDPVTSIRHVEILTNFWEEGDAITSAWFLDDAVAPSSYSYDLNALTLTLNGMWHLNGKAVSAFVAGVDAGDYTVVNGSIAVQFDGTANALLTSDYLRPFLTALPAVVGFQYNSDGQVLRLADQKQSGVPTGAALGKMQRAQEVAILVTDTSGGNDKRGLLLGTDFATTLLPALFSLMPPNGPRLAENVLFSGVHRHRLVAPYSFDNDRLTWRCPRMYPATICALNLFQDAES